MRQMRIWIPLVMLCGLPASVQAAPYDDCVALVGTDPTEAERQAYQWAQADGGAPARHCQALAMLAQGAGRKAAEMMVDIAATERTLPDDVRAEILAEAGEIFMEIGDLRPAQEAADRALLLARRARGPLTLAARIKADRGDWQGAVNDLDGALSAGDPDAELLVLRASARLRLGALVAARSDLIWAEELDPDLPSLWLEKGALAELNKDKATARSAWLKAIDLDRDGPVGEAAQLRLQRMDAG